MMAWKTPTQIDDQSLAFALLIWGINAIDLERGLCLYTTNGRTRNARRWFVRRFDVNDKQHAIQYNDGRVSFRAWNLQEALERLNEKRILNRINQLVDNTHQEAG
jgi:hypothetical protein